MFVVHPIIIIIINIVIILVILFAPNGAQGTIFLSRKNY